MRIIYTVKQENKFLNSEKRKTERLRRISIENRGYHCQGVNGRTPQ
jgi:hypothetical protein